MDPICADNHRLFFTKKSLLDIDNPPRKLLHRRSNLSISLPNPDDQEQQQRELPDGGGGDAYSSDEFRMYEFKIRRCMRGRSHDWTDCPFAHQGERARRRDPRRHHYSGNICPEFRRSGSCPRGDDCEFAHGVFECWLHPARYRTMPCKDGRRCRRKVCFFAHSPRQLRLLPSSNSTIVAVSPTSTLISFSSPPLSPPISPYYYTNNNFKRCGAAVGYEAVIGELLSRLKATQLSPTVTGPVSDIAAESSGSNCGPDLEWVEELLM